MGSLIAGGSTLYGMTELGGAYGAGTIFKMNADGTGYSILHSFIGGSSDGCNPYGSLILIDSALYGLTFKGGSGHGTLFKIYTNGSGFTLLHSFSGDLSNGYYPYGSLIAIGSTLFGMTYYGGTNGAGTIFKIETDGTGFSLIHSFAGGASDGSNPTGSLKSFGSVLFGMTQYGGTNNTGTIFKINTNGTGFMLLHSFTNTVIDGTQANGDLLLSGATLYGMTPNGGLNGAGIIFKINMNGTGFALLHSFNWPSDGYYPNGSLIEFNNVLYGMTVNGGVGVSSSTTGTIFQINKNGTGYLILHTFANSGSDGIQPQGDLLLIGSKLYGMASGGGAHNCGVIFSQTIQSQGGGTLKIPILISPANNAINQLLLVTLKWTDTNTSLQELHYVVRMKLEGGVYAYTTLAANTVQYIKSGLLHSKKYYWSVAAWGNGTTIKNSAWPADRNFTTQSQGTGTLKMPVLISPANNAINQPLPVTLKWTDTNTSLQELHYVVRMKLEGG
ncbi:MAG: hypothetical protein NTW38_11550, partial [Candidatus Aminicenantes bacterium]|nr:hypothetical protein [Candidatus Aminicenantes bacterium]